jgi:hypothetical protein
MNVLLSKIKLHKCLNRKEILCYVICFFFVLFLSSSFPFKDGNQLLKNKEKNAVNFQSRVSIAFFLFFRSFFAVGIGEFFRK